jgi:DNA-binding NtrC family response regulator
MASPNDEAALQAATDDDIPIAPLVGRDVASVERALILETLAACGGNRTQAARILGLTPRTIRNKLRAWHVRPAVDD